MRAFLMTYDCGDWSHGGSKNATFTYRPNTWCEAATSDDILYAWAEAGEPDSDVVGKRLP